jgi:hypothetical protein
MGSINPNFIFPSLEISRFTGSTRFTSYSAFFKGYVFFSLKDFLLASKDFANNSCTLSTEVVFYQGPNLTGTEMSLVPLTIILARDEYSSTSSSTESYSKTSISGFVSSKTAVRDIVSSTTETDDAVGVLEAVYTLEVVLTGEVEVEEVFGMVFLGTNT